MRKICVVTGTRAEYGLLSRLMRLIKESDQTELQIIATNMHLSPKYGNTYQEIEKDGFVIDEKIPILNEEKDDANATIKSMAKALSGFADAYDELKPDLVVVLGDRYEILAAATAALIECIPIAHIHGGEITEGAYDDAIRHSITKMSHLHFTSTEEYRRRVIQLGEQPERVFYVGALGVENITSIPLMAKEEVEESIGFMIDRNTILVTYHPVTLSRVDVKTLIKDFLSALQERTNLRIVFTMPNSDNGGSIISKEIEQFVARNNDRAICFKSLGIKRYLSLMKQVSAVVGNSSSGILEAPSFRIPTLNIGDRQTGRVAAESVYNCAPDKVSILTGLDFIFSDAFKEKAAQAVNPYDKSGTAEAIFNVIKSYPLNQLEHKHFFDIPQ